VKKRCNQLKEILRKIDEIWNPVISKVQINFNKKKIKDILMGRMLVLFEYNSKDFSKIIKENYPFNNELVNLFDYKNISEWVEKQINGYDEKNLFNKLIFDILPKCNQIMNKQSSLTSIASVNLRFYGSFTSSNTKMLLPVLVPVDTLFYGYYYSFLITHYSLLWFSGISGTYYETLHNYIYTQSNKDNSKISKPYIENCGSYEKEIYEALNQDM
jgi:hypothetical protein